MMFLLFSTRGGSSSSVVIWREAILARYDWLNNIPCHYVSFFSFFAFTDARKLWIDNIFLPHSFLEWICCFSKYDSLCSWLSIIDLFNTVEYMWGYLWKTIIFAQLSDYCFSSAPKCGSQQIFLKPSVSAWVPVAEIFPHRILSCAGTCRGVGLYQDISSAVSTYQSTTIYKSEYFRFGMVSVILTMELW